MGFVLCVLEEKRSFLSIEAAASWNSGVSSSILCLRAAMRSRKDVAIFTKSSLLFCFLYLKSSPMISPFRQLGG